MISYFPQILYTWEKSSRGRKIANIFFHRSSTSWIHAIENCEEAWACAQAQIGSVKMFIIGVRRSYWSKHALIDMGVEAS